MLRSRMTLVATLAVIALVTPASAMADGEVGDDSPPVISNATFTPMSLGYLGGTVTFTADVTDDIALSNVYAIVYSPTYDVLEMTHTTGNTFRATLDVPPNYSQDYWSALVEIQASDNTAHVTSVYPGELYVAGQPQFDDLPVITDPVVSPRSLPSSGGEVALAVTATDTEGIGEVYALVTPSNAPAFTVPLTRVSASRFADVLHAPANAGTGTITYEIEMVGLDSIGQQATVSAGIVTVAAQPTGRIDVKRERLDFGSRKLGTIAPRVLEVRNTGPKGTAAITGVITV